MTRRATRVGYTNRHGQTVIGRMTVVDRVSAIYVLRCEDCGLEYSAYEIDVKHRRCPHDADAGRPARIH